MSASHLNHRKVHGVQCLLVSTNVYGVLEYTRMVGHILCERQTAVVTTIHSNTSLQRSEITEVVSENTVIINQNVIGGGTQVVNTKDFIVIDDNVVAHIHLVAELLEYGHHFLFRDVLVSTDINGVHGDTLATVNVKAQIIAVVATPVDRHGMTYQSEIGGSASEHTSGIVHQVGGIAVHIHIGCKIVVDDNIIAQIQT